MQLAKQKRRYNLRFFLTEKIIKTSSTFTRAQEMLEKEWNYIRLQISLIKQTHKSTLNSTQNLLLPSTPKPFDLLLWPITWQPYSTSSNIHYTLLCISQTTIWQTWFIALDLFITYFLHTTPAQYNQSLHLSSYFQKNINKNSIQSNLPDWFA